MVRIILKIIWGCIMGNKILVMGALNNFDNKVKKFLFNFEKENFDDPKSWEPKIFKFFSSEAFVFYVGTIQKNKESLDAMNNDIGNHFMGFLKKSILHLDTNILFKNLIELNEYLKHDGDISEYYSWLFIINFQIRQMYTKRIDNNDTNYKKFSTFINMQNWTIGKNDKKLYQRVWIICPDNTVIYPFQKYWEKVDMLIGEEINKIKNKKKKIKKRDPIESRLRHEVFKRDNYICKECGKTKENTTLHVDHIIPVSQGGNDELNNLQTLCQSCNLAKSNRKWKAGDINNE